MTNLEQLLMRIEKNYQNKDKREKTEFRYKGNVYEVLLLTRSEKADLIFSRPKGMKNGKDSYEWLKPYVYKCFQLKDAAIKAKESGYIKTYYEVVDMLFDPDELIVAMNFILEANNLCNFYNEEIELQKK